MGLVAKAFSTNLAPPRVTYAPTGFGTSLNSGWSGQQQYQQLARTYTSNELIYAATELIGTSAAEPDWIGHRWRRNAATPRIAIQNERRKQVLQGRKNRANAMMADAFLVLNGFMEETPDHPLIRILNNPNPYISGNQLWGSIARDLLIAGDAYVYKARYAEGLLQGAVGELWRLRPDRVRPDTSGPLNELTGYVYTVNGVSQPFPRADVIHFKKGQHPFNDFLGWSPLMTLLKRVLIDNDQRDFLAAFYETGGTGPGSILNVKGKMEQKDKDDIRDRNRRQFGPGNFLEMMVIDQSDGVTYTPLSLNRGLRDALPVDVNSITETRIAAAYGIPGSILGLLVAYANGAYASRKQDWQTLWDITMTPFLEDIGDQVNLDLTPEFAGIDEVCPDLSDIRALAEDVFAVHDNARKNVDAGIWTVERARLETGEPAEAPDGEHQLLPTRSTLVKWPLPEGAPENPAPLALPPSQPAALIGRAVEMIAVSISESRRVGRPRLEDDPEARADYEKALQFKAQYPNMTWAQISERVGVSDRTLRRYRDAFEDDED